MTDFYTEVNCQQRNHEGERICGDVFISKRVREERRTIVVLSDGMGHGVKANMLATLTATMAVNFTREHKDFQTIAEIIMNTLPVCSVRNISYSTFTIIDVEDSGTVSILEYDNPQCVVMRGNKIFDPGWKKIVMESEQNKGKELHAVKFQPQKEDRIVFWSDGIIQSGLGSPKYPFGWGVEAATEFVQSIVRKDPFISARKLAQRVLNMGVMNDNYVSKDDTSCGAIYFREPRKLLISTGPPYEMSRDIELAMSIHQFEGKKIICGATTAEIIARELGRKIEDEFEFHDPDLPPVSHMQGVDLITEGILTLSKVYNILNGYSNNTALGNYLLHPLQP
ncbi:MAG: SpoIIE family protein phosphatase [Salinivirgaceae bacterium]